VGPVICHIPSTRIAEFQLLEINAGYYRFAIRVYTQVYIQPLYKGLLVCLKQNPLLV
jgi:hypothetical protein